MRKAKLVAFATWMVEHLTFGLNSEALAGDLLEELIRGRSTEWYWRQVCNAIAAGVLSRMRDLALPLVFCAAWTSLYPGWNLLRKATLDRIVPDGSTVLGWPYSALLPLGYGLAPALAFVWLGFLAYLALRPRKVREVSAKRVLWGLSASLNVLLVSTILPLWQFRRSGVDVGFLMRDDFYSAFHLLSVSIPLALSLLTALFFTMSRHPRLTRRRQLSTRPIRRTLDIMPALCFILVLFRASGILAQAAVNPARGQLAQWLIAFDGTSKNTYAQFLQKNFPSRAGRLQQDWAFREYTGGFDLIKVEEEAPTKVTALIQERDSDRFARIEVDVEPVGPNRIVTLDLRPVERPKEFALAPMSDGDLIDLLRRNLQQRATADKFAGAVLIAKEGKSIFAKAYGLADRDRKIPNRLDTKFRIGSMNKMFTAVAILQLAQAGKIKLDDPLGRFLPDYPNQELAAKATIRQLLTHTAGTGDIFGPEFDAHRLELRTLDDYLNLYGDRAPRFEPGSRSEYSNYGFVLLGVVIEKVTGQTYYNYIRERIYRPAGMASTGSEPENKKIAGLAIGYTKLGTDSWHSNAYLLPYRGTSAGGGYSTVGDLLDFANALREYKLLNPRYTAMLETPQLELQTGPGSYSYGFRVHTMNGSRCIGHSGGSPGMNGDLEMCLNSGDVVVTLANMDPLVAQKVNDFIVYRLNLTRAQQANM